MQLNVGNYGLIKTSYKQAFSDLLAKDPVSTIKISDIP